MNKFPSLNCTNLKDWDNVYEPSDDTFLLCDSLRDDIDEIITNKPKIPANTAPAAIPAKNPAISLPVFTTAAKPAIAAQSDGLCAGE
jgi:hypothetical protein